MKTKENMKLVTVGRLMKELSKYERKCADYDVVCWAEDDNTCCIVGHTLDEDGDLCIILDIQDGDGGYDNVEMLLTELSSYDKNAKVYLACGGYYLNFEQEGSIFTASDEDEIVGCYASTFGEYDKEDEKSGFLTEADKRYLAEEKRKETRENRCLDMALVALSIFITCLLAYNVYALISHTGKYIAENIMWIVLCPILLVIIILTLHNNKNDNK